MAQGVSGSLVWDANVSWGQVRVNYTETYDVVKNQSVVTVTSVQAKSTNWYGVTYYPDGVVKVNGQVIVRMDSYQGTHNVRIGSQGEWYTIGNSSGSVTVQHDSNGQKTIDIGLFENKYSHFTFITIGGGYGNGWWVYGNKSLTLTSIDRAAPSIRASVTNITSSGFTISASSDVAISEWWYSTNGGSSWTKVSGSGTSMSKAVTGLAANTTYNVQACGRKKYNQVDGYSSMVSAKTLGATVLHSAGRTAADASTVKITAHVTVYDASFRHTLEIKHGSTSITSVSDLAISAGTADRTISLPASCRTAILNYMTDSKELKATLYITTYKSGTKVGSTSSCDCTFYVSEGTSKPSFSGFTYKDTATVVTDITLDSSLLLQDYSYLQVACNAGAGKNGATIKSYSATIGDASAASTGRIINVGEVGKSGNLTLTVTCTDSRGFSSSVSKTVTVIPYSRPKLRSCKLRRQDEVGALVQLSFQGTISPINIGGSAKNRLEHIAYRYKGTSQDTWSSWVALTSSTTISGTSFSFSSPELLTLNADNSFDFELKFSDRLKQHSALDIMLVLPQGTPFMAYRKRNAAYDFPRLGINNPNPKAPLDVGGVIRANGHNIMQVVMDRIPAGTNLNTLMQAGIYFQRDTPQDGLNYPELTFAMIEVFEISTNLVTQRFTKRDSPFTMYIRSKVNEGWSSWVQK